MHNLDKTMLAVGLALLLGLVSSPGEATPTCGSTVSGHVVFDSNLACSSSNGLIVGADNTTIDLAGFTLSCTGAGYQGTCQGLGFTGINTNGHSNVLITGSTITGFAVGVLVSGGSDVNVRGLTVTGPASPGAGSNNRPASTGIEVSGTVCPDPPDTIINIHGNDVSNQREGIELVGACCVNVGFNHVHDNNSDPVACHGILAVNACNNNFNNNLVERNGENLPRDGGLTILGAGSANNTATHNDVSTNCGDGISVRFGANNNQVVNNEARNNSTSNLGGQCFNVSPGAFFDLAAVFDGVGNRWIRNNQCLTQGNVGINASPIPAGVCNPGE